MMEFVGIDTKRVMYVTMRLKMNQVLGEQDFGAGGVIPSLELM